jgi:hypothetical protein
MVTFPLIYSRYRDGYLLLREDFGLEENMAIRLLNIAV